jgi:hypothetical protein
MPKRAASASPTSRACMVLDAASAIRSLSRKGGTEAGCRHTSRSVPTCPPRQTDRLLWLHPGTPALRCWKRFCQKPCFAAELFRIQASGRGEAYIAARSRFTTWTGYVKTSAHDTRF